MIPSKTPGLNYSVFKILVFTIIVFTEGKQVSPTERMF